MVRPLVAAIEIVGLTLVLGARTGSTASPVTAAAPGDPVLMAADLTSEELTAVI